MTTHERVCPTCDGSGEVVHPNDRHMHPADPDQRTVTCDRCAGTGYVTAVTW